jgi:hypothetical protein
MSVADTGPGLAIVREIALSHRDELHASNRGHREHKSVHIESRWTASTQLGRQAP